jgi:hypothetical protein
MILAQEIKFALQLSLSESYIGGTAITNDTSYSINIQQGANQLIVLPQEFSYIGEPNQAFVSFGRDEDNNDKKICITSKIKVGQRDLVEVYLNQDSILLALANDLPLEMIIHTNHAGIA